jgi:hypothetical protein
MGSLKKISKEFIFGWILIIFLSCVFVVIGLCSRKYSSVEEQNMTMQIISYILLAILSLGCLYFFPSFIVRIVQVKLFTGKYGMTLEILLTVITYLSNVLFLATFCYMVWMIDYFDCVSGFYNLGIPNVLGLMQLIIGVIFNTVLLSLLVNVYQSRMTVETVESNEEKNVRLTLENEEYILKYKLTDVIKK